MLQTELNALYIIRSIFGSFNKRSYYLVYGSLHSGNSVTSSPLAASKRSTYLIVKWEVIMFLIEVLIPVLL